MTKTLTEQWRDGTLPQGNYYVNAKNIYNGDLYKGEIDHFNGEAHWFRFAGVEEVLAPVPSYETVCKLEQLDEDLLVSQECLKMSNEKIERLQEKLSDAETIFKIIKRNMENPNWHKDRPYTDLEIAIKSQVYGYIERYGVK